MGIAAFFIVLNVVVVIAMVVRVVFSITGIVVEVTLVLG